MNEFKQAKKEYDEIPIPPELADRVQAGIQQGSACYAARKSRFSLRWAASAAACFALLLVGLNVSPPLAHAAANVPVLGGFFRMLTVASYHTSEDGIDYEVIVPGLEAEGDLAERVNAAIQEKVALHLAKAQRDWADYRDAFFATGGTEDEWGGREMDVIIDYEVKSQTDTQVSFVVTMAEGWVASMEERYYYNLDFAGERELTLQDILGDEWVALCNESIQAQIDASADETGFSYFFTAEEGGFTTVDETTSFYIREDGTVVVAFPRYSIAAGAAGIPEFPIS